VQIQTAGPTCQRSLAPEGRFPPEPKAVGSNPALPIPNFFAYQYLPTTGRVESDGIRGLCERTAKRGGQ